MNKIELGGKEHPFAFNMNATEAFEELSGEVLSNFEKLLTNISAKTAKQLCYCGLVEGYRIENIEVDFNILDVGGWLGFLNLQSFVDILTKEMEVDPKNLKAPKKGQKKNP